MLLSTQLVISPTIYSLSLFFFFFFFNDTATTEIYTLSLHDALPIFEPGLAARRLSRSRWILRGLGALAIVATALDRKSTRLNSSHSSISYAVFCLKKKKTKEKRRNMQRTFFVVSEQTTSGKVLTGR